MRFWADFRTDSSSEPKNVNTYSGSAKNLRPFAELARRMLCWPERSQRGKRKSALASPLARVIYSILFSSALRRSRIQPNGGCSPKIMTRIFL